MDRPNQNRNIVVGQSVDPAKAERARELRREMTPEERILWQHLRANRLDGLRFRRQQVIDGFIVDFYCHAAGLVVELDGPIHVDQAEDDRQRDAMLAGRGLLTLRFTNDAAKTHLLKILTEIVTICRSRIHSTHRTISTR